MTVLSLPDLELGIELQGKTNALLLHKNSDCHLNSVAKREALTSMSKAGQTVTGLLDKAHQDRVHENRHYIITIAVVLRLTCTRNIAQRGHDEKADSFNRGNFLEILNLVAGLDEIVHARLHGAQNGNTVHRMGNIHILQFKTPLFQ